MNAFGFTQDERLTDVLKRGGFTVSAEVIPPRNGTEQLAILNQIDALVRSGAQFLAVTKGAGGSLRGGSLPIAQAIKERFKVPCIAHFTCRDLTPQETENQLMDHSYFGIRNILALRGDPPSDQKEWSPKAGSYAYAYQLIEQIRDLNAGKFLERTGGGRSVMADEPSAHRTDFCIGAATYPEQENAQERVDFVAKKVRAGAEYGITQMIFDSDIYARHLDELARVGIQIPVLPGTRVVKTRKQAESMARRFGVSLPASLLQVLPEVESSQSSERVLEWFERYAQRLKAVGAPGFHVFVLSDTANSCKLIERVRAQNR